MSSGDRVSRNAGFALLAQVAGAVCTGGLTIFLARSLSAEQYGYFAFGMSVLMIASMFADFGIAASTGRFIAERRHDRASAASVFRTGLGLKVLAGLTASLALAALAGPICDAFGAPGATWVLRALAISLFGQTVFLLLLGAFIALGVVRWNALLATIESVVEATSAVAFVLFGAAAVGAALGRATGYLVGAAVGLIVASRVVGSLRGRNGRDSVERIEAAEAEPLVTPRMILTYAGPLVLVDAAFRIFASIDVLLVSAIVGAGAPVAAYGLALQLTLFLEYPGAAMASAVAPRLAQAPGAGADDRADSLDLFTQSVRYLMILQVLLAAPLVIWPEAIVDLLFGDKYGDVPDVLLALVPFVLLSALAQISTLGVNYLGEARRRIPIAVVMLSVNIVIALILLPRIGIVGAAIGTSVAYAIWVPGHLWILHKRIGFELRPLLVTTARAGIAGAAMVGTLALIGTGEVAFPLMLIGAVLGPAVYVGTLLLLREVTPGDVAVVRNALARRAG